MRGRRPALQGRPRLGAKLSSQMVIGDGEDEDGGVVRYKLPGGKQCKKRVSGHSLASAVISNRRSTKKH